MLVFASIAVLACRWWPAKASFWPIAASSILQNKRSFCACFSMPHTSAPSVNANGGFWHHQKDKQDRVALSEFIISSLALELASDQLADAWGMHLGSAADVSCFREALAVG